MTNINTDRLRVVAQHIRDRKNADSFNMDNVAFDTNRFDAEDSDEYEHLTIGAIEHTCGTGGCFAGWIAAIYAPDTPLEDSAWVVNEAQKAIGFTDDEAEYLFFTSQFWPKAMWNDEIGDTILDAVADDPEHFSATVREYYQDHIF